MNELLLLVFLLILSGVFSGSETALVALSMARAEALRRAGRPGAKALYQLKSDSSRMLITILIGNNVVNISSSALATVIATEYLGDLGPGIAVGVLTFLILIFGEITPKSLATRYAERISLTIATPMLVFMRLIFPFVWLFSQLTNWFHSSLGSPADPTVTESELITMVEHGEEEGTIEAEERQLIERVFTLGDLMVEDVMTSRGQVFSLSETLTLEEALPQIIHESYSRIPVYRDQPDDIHSILFLRDVLHAVVHGNLKQPIAKLGRKPLFAPRNQPINELITQLRRKKQHLAVVVDEHGWMQGVVSLEDLLEELVGEIYDESDEMPDEAMELPGGALAVDGTTELRVVEAFFQIDLPGKPTDSVNRWLLEHTERIPEEGEQFVINDLEVAVQSASSRRVEQIIIRQIQASNEQPTVNEES